MNFFRLIPTATVRLKNTCAPEDTKPDDILIIAEYVQNGESRKQALARLDGEWLGLRHATQSFLDTYSEGLPLGILDWIGRAPLPQTVPVIFLLPKQWVDLNAHLIKYEAFQ
jgi:hypothetical protein